MEATVKKYPYHKGLMLVDGTFRSEKRARVEAKEIFLVDEYNQFQKIWKKYFLSQYALDLNSLHSDFSYDPYHKLAQSKPNV